MTVSNHDDGDFGSFSRLMRGFRDFAHYILPCPIKLQAVIPLTRDYPLGAKRHTERLAEITVCDPFSRRDGPHAHQSWLAASDALRRWQSSPIDAGLRYSRCPRS